MSDPNVTDRELFDLFEGSGDPAELAALAERIGRDPKLRRRYIRTMALAAHLRYLASATARQSPQVKPTTAPIATPVARTSSRRAIVGTIGAALAAAAAIGIAAFIYGVLPIRQAPEEPANPTGPTVAILVASDRTEWRTDPVNPGDELRTQSLAIGEGSYTIDLLSGATVSVIGPAEMSLVSADRCVLHHGRLEAIVPADAVGFTVDAPNGVRIVDLGTAFSVDVDEAGHTTVAVSEGRVRVERLGEDGQPMRSRYLDRGAQLVADADDWRYEPALGALPGTIHRTDRHAGYTVRATQAFGTPVDLPAQPAVDDLIAGMRGVSSTGYVLERFTDGLTGPDGPPWQTLWHTVKRPGDVVVHTYELDQPTRIGAIHVFSSFTDARAFQHYDVEVREAGAATDAWTPRYTGIVSGRIGQRAERVGKWEFDLTQIEPDDPAALAPIEAIRFRFYPVTGESEPADPAASESSEPRLNITRFAEPNRGVHHSGVYEIDVFPIEHEGPEDPNLRGTTPPETTND